MQHPTIPVGHATPATPPRLMRAGANISAVQETGDTPLSLAAYFGRPRAVEELVRRGADVECRDREGLAPGEAFEQGVDASVRRRVQVRIRPMLSLTLEAATAPHVVPILVFNCCRRNHRVDFF